MKKHIDMKKIFVALMAGLMLMATACKKEDNNVTPAEEPTTVELAGTQWVGVIENDPEQLHYVSGVLITHAEYTLTFSDKQNGTFAYDMTTLFDGDEYDDQDLTDITYTFDGKESGTLTVEGEAMPFSYNATDETLVIPLDNESGTELNTDKIVLHRK